MSGYDTPRSGLAGMDQLGAALGSSSASSNSCHITIMEIVLCKSGRDITGAKDALNPSG
jgi:hypothetical protein